MFSLLKLLTEADIQHEIFFNLKLFVFIVQVSIVGDFSEEEIESCVLDYLGTVRASRDSERAHGFSPILFRPSPSDLQFQQVRPLIKLLLHTYL